RAGHCDAGGTARADVRVADDRGRIARVVPRVSRQAGRAFPIDPAPARGLATPGRGPLGQGGCGGPEDLPAYRGIPPGPHPGGTRDPDYRRAGPVRDPPRLHLPLTGARRSPKRNSSLVNLRRASTSLPAPPSPPGPPL